MKNDSIEIREELRFHLASPLICKFKGPGSLGSPGFLVFEHGNIKKRAPDEQLASQTVCDPSSLLATSPAHPDPGSFHVCRTEQRRHFSYQEKLARQRRLVRLYPGKEAPTDHEPVCSGCSASPLLPLSLRARGPESYENIESRCFFIFKRGGKEAWGKGGSLGSWQSTVPRSDEKD